jgi:ABC-2 type transport system ATP-binding protein
LLGPNGAGKSTCVKMLLSLAAPSGGEGLVLGRPLGDVEVRGRIGFLPEQFRFYEWLTGEELLRVHGRLAGVQRGRLRQRVPQLLETVGLTSHARVQLRHYSKGMLQRIGLAQALVQEPELIILDEPTSVLDPGGRILVHEIIQREHRRGATVLLNSHILSDVERACDRVAFMKGGQVLQTRDLRSPSPAHLAVAVRARRASQEIVEGLSPWATQCAVQALGDGMQRISFGVAAEDVLPEIHRFLVSHGVDVFELSLVRQSLEELFLQIVGGGGDRPS